MMLRLRQLLHQRCMRVAGSHDWLQKLPLPLMVFFQIWRHLHSYCISIYAARLSNHFWMANSVSKGLRPILRTRWKQIQKHILGCQWQSCNINMWIWFCPEGSEVKSYFLSCLYYSPQNTHFLVWCANKTIKVVGLKGFEPPIELENLHLYKLSVTAVLWKIENA